MQWIIQNSGITFASLDNNVAPLVEAIDALGDARIAVGVIPFTDTIVGLEEVNRELPTLFYGSTRLVEIASTLNFNPGVFYDKEWFFPNNWLGKRPDLLNESQSYMTAGELRKNWIDELFFVKSSDPKILTGMVLEGNIDQSWWIEEYSHISDDANLVISPVQEIEQEWRFFLIDGKIITGSQYKHNGILRIREPIPENIWKQAHRMSQYWIPSPNIVMDIAKMKDGSFKVVEWNCINASGWYNSTISSVIIALNSIYS